MSDIPRLICATLCILAPPAILRLRPHRAAWTRILITTAAMVAVAIIVMPMSGSPLHPDIDRDNPTAAIRLWRQLCEAGWWVLVARLAIVLLQVFVVLEDRPREERIVNDLFTSAIVIAAALAIVNFAFDVPIRGLLATSGVIAIVLGLALQSTMADVFSGIAVGIERPYKAGDLINIDNSLEGTVLQVTWRATHIAANGSDIAIVPNSIIAKAKLLNRTSPSPIRHDTLTIAASAAASPDHVRRTLVAAVATSGRVMPIPAPSIACTALRGDAIVFEIGFSVADSDGLTDARHDLLEQVYTHLALDGIPLAITGVASAPVAPPTPEALLARSDVAGLLSSRQQVSLARHMEEVRFSPGDIILSEDARADALFLIAGGAVEITTHADGHARVIARLGPGPIIGAIGMIARSFYGATATALTPVRAYRIARHDVVESMREHPLSDDERAVWIEKLRRRVIQDPVHRDDVPSQKHQATRERLHRLWEVLRD